jgi:O-antigen biosynthesis protein
VGATLLYPDGVVQHSGVIVGLHDGAEHAFKTLAFRHDSAGYLCGLHATREYSAVTAACMLVPAGVFHAVQGYNEKLEVGFNDTDLCLRIGQKGYRVINCADAILLHHESQSRGKCPGQDPHIQDTVLFRHSHQYLFQNGDPHFSPLLARDNPTFVLDPSARLKLVTRYRSVTGPLPKLRRPSPVARERDC